MILSEAAVKLGETASEMEPDIPWNNIRGLGNHIRHAYDGVSEDTIWDILTEDLGSLREACRRVVAQLGSSQDPHPGSEKSNSKF